MHAASLQLLCVCVVVACAFVRHNQGILLFSTQNNQPHLHAVISLCRKSGLLCVLFTLCDIIVTFNHPPPPCKHNFIMQTGRMHSCGQRSCWRGWSRSNRSRGIGSRGQWQWWPGFSNQWKSSSWTSRRGDIRKHVHSEKLLFSTLCQREFQYSHLRKGDFPWLCDAYRQNF